MYALSRGPNKIVASTRRGPPKQIDSLENREFSSKRAPGEPVMSNFYEKKRARSTFSSPKPVFNGKRNVTRSNSFPQEPITPQHEEIVRYLHDAWSKVRHDFELSQRSGATHCTWYKEKNPNPNLQGFKAFDLEEYWGQRTLEKLELTEKS